MKKIKLNRQELTSTLLDFYKNPVAQVSTELFLTIGAIIFFALFAIRPTLVTMSDLVNELEEKRKLRLKLEEKIAALASLQGQYSTWSQRASVLDDAFPTNPELIKVLKIIEKAASDNKLAILSLTVSELPKTKTAEIPVQNLSRLNFPLTVTLLGEYDAIKQFIDDIQSNQRIITIDSITFSTKENSKQRQLSASIVLSAQYFGKK